MAKCNQLTPLPFEGLSYSIDVAERFVCADVPVGKEASFSVNTQEAGPGQAKLSVVSPSSQPVAAAVEPVPEGFTGKFVPQELGPHTVHVDYADQPIPGSPFRVNAVQV